MTALATSLAMVAHAAASARDPWWIIGSAALVLHGFDPGRIGDVDLLMSPSDATAILMAQGVAPRPGVPNDRFRSAVFGRWSAGGMTVETMGGFDLHGPKGWRSVVPKTREPIPCGDAILFVPGQRELAELLHGFGRAKDLRRIDILQAR